MPRRTTFSRTAGILALQLFTSQAASAQSAAMPGMAHPTTPADQAMQEGMQKMSRDMAAAPSTGDADHDFVAMMLPHHQGAVDMAKTELRFGKDPMLRRLAAAIVADQEREMAEMQEWQRAHKGEPARQVP